MSFFPCTLSYLNIKETLNYAEDEAIVSKNSIPMEKNTRMSINQAYIGALKTARELNRKRLIHAFSFDSLR